ncbi:tripartite motif-containing protein 16-like [Hemiscyllium ocellatum]|uniref:tripartite motif-containing protein 16-like n=1 Tax=Hemiscyllium ocellatum TaxID=170820 RepID=UPI002966F785|nr:tripartite motif-containing protein 16-like [Hemiscyllium ocellatum]
MAVSKVSISEAKLACAICLDLLKSPATIPCGHNFCMECIGRCWHQEGGSETFRCPQCRETFSSRPSLSKNTILCEIVEDFSHADPACASKEAVTSQGVLCDFCTDEKLEAVKSCVVCMASYCEVHLQPHSNNPVFSDHRLIDPVRDIERRKCPSHRKPLEVFCRTDQKCVCCLCAINEHRQHETVSVEEQVGELKKELNEQQTEVDKQLLETTEEIGKLQQKADSIKGMVLQVKHHTRTKCTELVKTIERAQKDVLRYLDGEEEAVLSRVEESMKLLRITLAGLQDSKQQLQTALESDDSLFVLQEHWRLNKPVRPVPISHCEADVNFSTVENAMTELSNHIAGQLHSCFNPHLEGEVSKDNEKEIYTSPAIVCPMETKADLDSKQKADYVQHALRLTFDLNTAHKHLLLSDDNCTVTDVDPESVPYPEHPDRFSNFPQVLCAESLSGGRCYWEVEISGHWAGMGVTYRGIKRKGSNMCSLIGRNSLSWCLLYSNSKYSALHNKQEVSLQSGRYQRIGIYLDYPEGTLDFYGIDNTMSLIHRFKTEFTEPVYPAFWVFLGTSLRICWLD